MEKNKLTICANCKHRLIDTTKTISFNPDIWYNNYCLSNLLDSNKIDVVTGKPLSNAYAYCRDINKDGKCKFYEEKPERRKNFYKVLSKLWE